MHRITTGNRVLSWKVALTDVLSSCFRLSQDVVRQAEIGDRWFSSGILSCEGLNVWQAIIIITSKLNILQIIMWNIGMA